jgi:hypothetical protein
VRRRSVSVGHEFARSFLVFGLHSKVSIAIVGHGLSADQLQISSIPASLGSSTRHVHRLLDHSRRTIGNPLF